MKQYLPFIPHVFLKVLAAVLTLVLLGWLGSYLIYEEVTTVDMVGSMISGVLFAYLVHLWITMGKDW